MEAGNDGGAMKDCRFPSEGNSVIFNQPLRGLVMSILLLGLAHIVEQGCRP